MKLPVARNTDIVVQDAGTELLIYDLTNHKAYNLNGTAAKVFNACDGRTTFNDLKRKHRFTDNLIYLTLDELKKNDLLDENYQAKCVGVSRREVIKRIGLASMIALPVISTLVAPTGANAASCVSSGSPGGGIGCLGTVSNCNSFCNSNNSSQCCSGAAQASSQTSCSPTVCTCVCS